MTRSRITFEPCSGQTPTSVLVEVQKKCRSCDIRDKCGRPVKNNTLVTATVYESPAWMAEQRVSCESVDKGIASRRVTLLNQ